MSIRRGTGLVAVVGLALALAAAWWLQNGRGAQPTGAEGGKPGVAAPAADRPGAGASAPSGAAGGATAGSAGAGGARGGGVPGVEVTTVKAIRLQDDVQAVGTLRSRQNVVVRPEVAGRIAEIAFADGARVRKGQVLVQLDDALQRAELSQAQAQVSIARANLKRNQELVAERFVAPRVVEESQAALQVAEAQLALAQARLGRMRIVAPFDGTVGIRLVNVGDYVKDGADLVNLEDTRSLYVDFRVPERVQAKLAPGQKVAVTLDALPGRSFEAQVQALDPLVDANGRSVAVRAVLPTVANSPLRPGMFARTTTVLGVNDRALVVPEEALLPQGGRQFVFVLDAAGEGEQRRYTSRRVEVSLGVRRAAQVEVTQGLAEGDTVVVAGQQRLQKDGTVVRVVDLASGPKRPQSAASPSPNAPPTASPAANPAAGGAPQAASAPTKVEQK